MGPHGFQDLACSDSVCSPFSSFQAPLSFSFPLSSVVCLSNMDIVPGSILLPPKICPTESSSCCVRPTWEVKGDLIGQGLHSGEGLEWGAVPLHSLPPPCALYDLGNCSD